MIYPLLTLAIALQALDWWTTTAILAAGGRELNPVLNRLFAKFGQQPTLIVYKGLVAAGCGYVAYTGFVEVLFAVNALYLLVVGNNTWQLVKARK